MRGWQSFDTDMSRIPKLVKWQNRLALLLPLIAGPVLAQGLIPVDDGYTVSQRYFDNKANYPEMRWPELHFAAGQSIQFDRRYKLVGSRELHIDIFLPAAANRKSQSMMLVHGGGWRSGNKSHLYALANLLAQSGYTVFLPEYRLSAEALYPAGLVDLNDAIVWIKSQAENYDIQPDQLAIVGGSSGGQMAALLAYTADQSLFKTSVDDDTRVNAMVDLDGVLDFTTPLAIKYENKAGDQSAVGLWFGGAMEKTADKWQQASAAKHVHPQAPPTLIISSGQQRFTAGKETVMRQLDEYGIRNKYVEYDEILHTFWLFEPWVSEVAATIDQFLTGTVE